MKLLIISCLLACAAADVSHILAAQSQASPDRDAKILSQEVDVGQEGQYQWSIKTDNGIQAQEQGELKNVGSESEAQVARGDASWTAPDGQTIQLQYVADENGYQPQGSHLPTPPPIPEAILRSLEYIRAHPPPPEN